MGKHSREYGRDDIMREAVEAGKAKDVNDAGWHAGGESGRGAGAGDRGEQLGGREAE